MNGGSSRCKIEISLSQSRSFPCLNTGVPSLTMSLTFRLIFWDDFHFYLIISFCIGLKLMIPTTILPKRRLIIYLYDYSSIITEKKLLLSLDAFAFLFLNCFNSCKNAKLFYDFILFNDTTDYEVNCSFKMILFLGR
jgi:hypothetical protein